MRIVVPAGVGDWCWIWVKLSAVRDQIEMVGVVDGAPRRTVPFIEACGIPAHYDRTVTFPMILQFEHLNELDYQSEPTWERIKNLGYAQILLEANRHLEEGRPLEDWLPDLPTNFHFPLTVSEEDKHRAEMTMMREMASHPMKEGPIVGISCASYRGAEAWRSWQLDSWIEFLTRVMERGWRPVLVGAGFDDLTYAVACDMNLPSTVGKTNMGQMIWQMNLLDAYVGFSSGMNVIRTIWNRPAMAIWPDFDGFSQAHLARSWVPPHMLESHRYEAALWRPVKDVWPVAKRFLDTCERELANGADKAAANGADKGAANGADHGASMTTVAATTTDS
jgi:hypothetical protein